MTWLLVGGAALVLFAVMCVCSNGDTNPPSPPDAGVWWFGSAAPGAPAPVDAGPGGGDVGPPAPSPPTHTGDEVARLTVLAYRPDSGTAPVDDDHRGSPDLTEFPPSNEELQYASRVVLNLDAFASSRVLMALTKSSSRYLKILRLVEREAKSADLLERIRP